MLHSFRPAAAAKFIHPESLTLELLQEKITPPAELPRVSRSRLNQTLQESLSTCNSTVVSGRKGTGKTMLVRDFTRVCGRRTAWYNVDASDAELAVFFQYLCSAVAQQRPGFGRKTLERVGHLLASEDVPLLVEYFVYELLERDEPLVVVIDDLHRVYDADWIVPFFRRLLPLLPPEVHVVLIGRSLPPAPLWRMRSKQTLCILDEDALALTHEEAERLFESYGMARELAAPAVAQTRGRAANLDALAASVRVREEAARLAASRSEGRRGRTFQLVKGFTKSSLGRA
jgi:LuxR family maltose regulon positive regulatory protein